jgi:hypothetical protein
MHDFQSQLPVQVLWESNTWQQPARKCSQDEISGKMVGNTVQEQYRLAELE